jgi:2-polyprenyl-3-methyl-5-hydroxy-6-metoxy-1,4-benzoquinol methylase
MWQKRLKRINRVKPAGRLLDIGCGEGLFIKIAQENGWNVEGTEISKYASKVASDSTGKKIWHGEPWSAEFKTASFDVVTIWHVLEHVVNPIKTLKEARRLLKPDGLCVVAVPNVNNSFMKLVFLIIKRKRINLFSPDDKELHLYHFSARTLKKFLIHSGFTKLSIRPDYGVIDTGKKIINYVSVLPYYLLKVHYYNSIEVFARP